MALIPKSLRAQSGGKKGRKWESVWAMRAEVRQILVFLLVAISSYLFDLHLIFSHTLKKGVKYFK